VKPTLGAVLGQSRGTLEPGSVSSDGVWFVSLPVPLGTLVSWPGRVWLLRAPPLLSLLLRHLVVGPPWWLPLRLLPGPSLVLLRLPLHSCLEVLLGQWVGSLKPGLLLGLSLVLRFGLMLMLPVPPCDSRAA